MSDENDESKLQQSVQALAKREGWSSDHTLRTLLAITIAQTVSKAGPYLDEKGLAEREVFSWVKQSSEGIITVTIQKQEKYIPTPEEQAETPDFFKAGALDNLQALAARERRGKSYLDGDGTVKPVRVQEAIKEFNETNPDFDPDTAPCSIRMR